MVYVSIQTEADFDKYKGKLAGKVVLFGAMREVPPVDKALFERYTDQDLADLASFPVSDGGGGGVSPCNAGPAADIHGACAADRQDRAVLFRREGGGSD